MWLFALLGGILGNMMSNFMGSRINKDGSVDESVWLMAEHRDMSDIFVVAMIFCGLYHLHHQRLRKAY